MPQQINRLVGLTFPLLSLQFDPRGPPQAGFFFTSHWLLISGNTTFEVGDESKTSDGRVGGAD
ncbi:MAG: hypothetical protein M3220_12420 [Chloroflexota bacterium]|nr:hypothetical protein [Chloroflexota bacterium]